jgi:hypothetical protein
MIPESDVLRARLDLRTACYGDGCIVITEHLGLLESGVEIELLEDVPAVSDVFDPVS